VKLVLDEHLSMVLARQLQARGHDVITARELLAGPDRSDAELLRRATEADRTVVTANVGDFVELHRAAVVSGRSHAGVILVSRRRFPLATRAVGGLVKALDAYLVAHPGAHELEGQTWWLEQGRSR
jgi:transposase